MTVGETSLYNPEVFQHTNKISWSKHGFIAYANQDFEESHHNLNITYMECVDGINWQLAPPKGFTIRPSSQLLEINNQLAINPNFKLPPPPAISAVSYGPNCADLAIIDSEGNVTIAVTGLVKLTEPSRSPLLAASLNELEVIYNDDKLVPTTIQASSDVVAFKWLPLDKPLIVNEPATRVSTTANPPSNGAAAADHGSAFQDASGQAYHYNVVQHKLVGPSHPISAKQAFVCVRRNGELVMWYQGEHGLDYFKISNFLEHQFTMSISKAAIGFNKDGKFVVAVYYDVCNILKVFLVSIDWGYLSAAAQMQKKVPSYVTPENNRILPSFKIDKWFRESMGTVDLETGAYRSLKILEVISPNHASGYSLEVLTGHESQVDGKYTSSFQMYICEPNMIPKLFGDEHADPTPFSSLSVKTRHTLRRNEAVVSVRTCLNDSFLVLSYLNGKIDILDRGNMEQIVNQFDKKANGVMSFNNPTSSLDAAAHIELPAKIRSLIDAGFEFPELGFSPCSVAVSPNLSSVVAMNPETKQLVWKTLQRKSDLMVTVDGKGFKKGFLILTASAFAFAHTSGCFSQSFTGDLITAIQMEIKRAGEIAGDEYAQKLLFAILEESQRSINFQLEYTRENADKLLNHPPFQKLLSLQLSLGTSTNWQRSRSSQIAYYILHLRLGSLVITLSLRTIFHQIQKESNVANKSNRLDETYIKSNSLISTIGFVRWFIDFCNMINQELLQIDDSLSKTQDPMKRKAIMESYIAVPVLLSTISRSLLLYSVAGIRKLNEYATKSVENIDLRVFRNIPVFEGFERLNSVIKSSPIHLDVFEKFVSDTDNQLRGMKLDKLTSTKVETQLFCHAKIPTVYLDFIGNMCSSYSNVARKDVDLIQLYFYDVEWLNPNKNWESSRPIEIIEPTSQANHELILKFKNKKNSLFLDELRKNLIISKNLRRCILCGSLSSCDEIPLYNVEFMSPTALPFQRSCFCSGYWVSLSK